MKPPALAYALLMAVAGDATGELVAGDLYEEFACLCAAHGRRAGNRWYTGQVLRSSAALLGLRMRSGEFAHIGAAAGLGIALPLLLLDRLWSLVYSNIPLKDGLHRAPGFLAANLFVLAVCAAACGASARTPRRAFSIALAGAAAAALALWCSVGATPTPYTVLVVSIAPAGSLAGWRIFR